MKTLLIKYLPSGQSSNTQKLLGLFLEAHGGKDLVVLDLLLDPAPAFGMDSMTAYKKRNYMAQGLSSAEALLLKPHDRLIAQLKAADRVVMAYPMHNFGMPGPVKTWFDAVMFSGETFEMSAQGPVPVMKGRKSLTLYTAGGIYPSEKSAVEYPFWDTLTTLAKIEFGFMGFDENDVISTSLREPSKVEEHLKDARSKIEAVLKRWRDSIAS